MTIAEDQLYMHKQYIETNYDKENDTKQRW